MEELEKLFQKTRSQLQAAEQKKKDAEKETKQQIQKLREQWNIEKKQEEQKLENQKKLLEKEKEKWKRDVELQLKQIEKEREKLKEEWNWIKRACGTDEGAETSTTNKSTTTSNKSTTPAKLTNIVPKIIKLNVGGKTFCTTKATLTGTFAESMLAAMFSGRHPLITDENGYYFIDRNGEYFGYILDYLRTRKLIVEKESILRKKLNEELQYFMIPFPEDIVQIPSSILFNSHKKKISEWIYKPRWKLIYKATQHGFTGSQFHSHCDFKKNLLVIIKAGCNIYGGYSTIGWCDSSNRNLSDPSAFIFTLVNPYNIPPTKYNIQQNAQSIYYDSRCGPSFGSGPDIYICDNSNSSSESYISFPSSFIDTTGKGNLTFTGQQNKFNITEIEVFIGYDDSEDEEYEDEIDNPSKNIRSKILSTKQLKQITKWIRNKKTLNLLYRGSRDGFGASDFHTKCDKKGATVTVIQSNMGWIFGGYTPIEWKSGNTCETDKNTFLFTLTNPHNIPPTTYTNTTYSILDYSNYGPSFGGPYNYNSYYSGYTYCNNVDLLINDQCNTNSNNCNFPCCFEDTTGKGNTTFTGNKDGWTVKEIEVFSC